MPGPDPVDPFQYLRQDILRKSRCLLLQEFRELRILRGARVPRRFVEKPCHQIRFGIGGMKECEGAHPVEDRPGVRFERTQDLLRMVRRLTAEKLDGPDERSSPSHSAPRNESCVQVRAPDRRVVIRLVLLIAAVDGDGAIEIFCESGQKTIGNRQR